MYRKQRKQINDRLRSLILIERVPAASAVPPNNPYHLYLIQQQCKTIWAQASPCLAIY